MRYRPPTSLQASMISKINCCCPIKDSLRLSKGILNYDSQTCVDQTYTEVDSSAIVVESQSLATKVETVTVLMRYRRTDLKDPQLTHTTMMTSKIQATKLGSQLPCSESRTSRLNGAVADNTGHHKTLLKKTSSIIILNRMHLQLYKSEIRICDNNIQKIVVF